MDAYFRLVKVRWEQGGEREVWTFIGITRSDGKVIGLTSDDDGEVSEPPDAIEDEGEAT